MRAWQRTGLTATKTLPGAVAPHEQPACVDNAATTAVPRHSARSGCWDAGESSVKRRVIPVAQGTNCGAFPVHERSERLESRGDHCRESSLETNTGYPSGGSPSLRPLTPSRWTQRGPSVAGWQQPDFGTDGAAVAGALAARLFRSRSCGRGATATRRRAPVRSGNLGTPASSTARQHNAAPAISSRSPTRPCCPPPTSRCG